MFLIPAFISLVADSLIVYLHRSLLSDVQDQQQEESANGGALYKVGYLALLAWLRILVLILPFLFHSYTGTALPCHLAYLTWYAVTLAVVLCHMSIH